MSRASPSTLLEPLEPRALLDAAGGSGIGTAAGPPPNDDFASAQVLLGLSGTALGTTLNASHQPFEPLLEGFGPRSVWYRWTAPAGADVVLNADTEGSAFDTALAVFAVPAGASAPGPEHLVAADDDSGAGRASHLAFRAVAGTRYHLLVDGFDGAAGALTIHWRPAGSGGPANDNLAGAVEIAGAVGQVAASNVDATREADEPPLVAEGDGRSVWYRWTAPAAGRYRFATQANTFDTLLAAYVATAAGAGVGDLVEVASNDDAQGASAGESAVEVLASAAGETFYLRLDGYDRQAGSAVLAWTDLPPRVLDVTLLDEAAPHRLAVRFSEAVAGLSDDDVLVVGPAPSGPGAAPRPFLLAGYDPATRTATYAFADGILPAGAYQVSVGEGAVIDSTGRPLAPAYAGTFRFLPGDVDHDGRITAADYHAIDAGHALGLLGYAHGDLDYSGSPPDVSDYLLIDASFMAHAAATGPTAAPAPPAALPPDAADDDDGDDDDDDDDKHRDNAPPPWDLPAGSS